MRPVCVNCEIEFRAECNGVIIVQMASFGYCEIRPYKLWMADLWKCPGCSREIVNGFGANAIFEHYKGDIQAKIEEHRKTGDRIITVFEKLAHRV